MKTFREYFITEAIKEDKKDETKTKVSKINTNFEDELRKIYKIKSVINTAFGIQIDFYKKPEKDEILNLVDFEVKFKGTSIFILFN